MTDLWARFLQNMTPAEREAIRRYQLDRTRIEREHTGERQLRLWAGILRILRESAAGSPVFDRYVEGQQNRWMALKAKVDRDLAA
jgi:hypothetical protein